MVQEMKREPISNSLFYMWRCVICVAHADGRIEAEERSYLERIFTALDRVHGLSEEQKAIFTDDMQKPKDIGSLLRHINDPYFRSQLIYFAHLMVHADGVLHPSEKELVDKLRSDQMASLDMEQIRRDVHDYVQNEMAAHDEMLQGLRPQKGLTRYLDFLLLSLGIDVLE